MLKFFGILTALCGAWLFLVSAAKGEGTVSPIKPSEVSDNPFAIDAYALMSGKADKLANLGAVAAAKRRGKWMVEDEAELLGTWLSDNHFPAHSGLIGATYEILTFQKSLVRDSKNVVQKAYWQYMDFRAFDTGLEFGAPISWGPLKTPVVYQRGHWERLSDGKIEFSDASDWHSVEAVFDLDLAVHNVVHPKLEELAALDIVFGSEGALDRLVIKGQDGRFRTYARLSPSVFYTAIDFLDTFEIPSRKLPCLLRYLHQFEAGSLPLNEAESVQSWIDVTATIKLVEGGTSALLQDYLNQGRERLSVSNTIKQTQEDLFKAVYPTLIAALAEQEPAIQTARSSVQDWYSKTCDRGWGN